MNIALICHPYHRGGVTSWMVDFFNLGVKNNSSISFVTLDPKEPFISAKDRPKILDLLDSNGLIIKKEVDYKFELGLQNFKINTYRNLILNHVPKGSILIPSDDNNIWAACATVASEYIFCGVLHSDDAYYYKLYDQYKDYTAAMVSVSERIQKKLANLQNGFVIPCGIPLDKFYFENSKKKKIAWVGRLEEFQKRVSDIIPIATRILQNYPDWKFYIVGNGAEYEKLKMQIKDINLEDSIYLVGWKESEYIRQLLSESRILLQTSNFEGMSVAMMEALGSGCQILSTKVSGVEDLEVQVASKGIVETYPIGDIEKAFEGFQSLIQIENNGVARKANVLANSEFSIEACFRKYFKVFENLKPTKNLQNDFTRGHLYSSLIAFLRKSKYIISK